jgi:hypothetical protein
MVMIELLVKIMLTLIVWCSLGAVFIMVACGLYKQLKGGK